MMIRSFTLVFAFLFSICTVQLNAQNFGIVIDSVEVVEGEDVCVPVRAKGFVDILSFQFSIPWDQAVLALKGTQHYGLPGLSALEFGVIQNHLLVVWSSPTGSCTTKADGEILFEVCFSAVGAVGSTASLVPGSGAFHPTSGGAEAHSCLGMDVWNNNNNEPGNVTITAVSQGSSSTFEANAAQSAFKLFPNPTNAGTQMLVDAPASGWAVLRVTDSMGKTIWSARTTVLEGENALRIPEDALPGQGLYQVSLQTGHGVSTQMLLVR